MKKSGGIIPDFYARFRIVNPTNTPVTVKSITGQLYLNKKLLADIQQLTSTTISANEEIEFEIRIKPSAYTALVALYNIVKKKEKLTLNFEGNVNSSGFVLPVSAVIVQDNVLMI